MSIISNDFCTSTPTVGTGNETIPEKAVDGAALPGIDQLKKVEELAVSGNVTDDDRDGMHNAYPFGSIEWMRAAEKERARREATFVEGLADIDALINNMEDKWTQILQAEMKIMAEDDVFCGNTTAPWRGFFVAVVRDMARARSQLMQDEIMRDVTAVNDLVNGVFDQVDRIVEEEEDDNGDERSNAVIDLEEPIGLVDCKFREKEDSESVQQRVLVKAVVNADKEAFENQVARLWRRMKDADDLFTLVHTAAHYEDEEVDDDSDDDNDDSDEEDEDEDVDEEDDDEDVDEEDEDEDVDEEDENENEDVDESEDDDEDVNEENEDEDRTATEIHTGAVYEHGHVYGYWDPLSIEGRMALQRPLDLHVDRRVLVSVTA